MATTLNGTTIADPVLNNPIGQKLVGKHERAHDGTMLTDYTAVKRAWTVEWKLLTAAQRNAIMSIVSSNVGAAINYSPPHESAVYSIVIDQDSVEETVGYSWFNLKMVMEEA